MFKLFKEKYSKCLKNRLGVDQLLEPCIDAVVLMYQDPQIIIYPQPQLSNYIRRKKGKDRRGGF